MAALGRVLQVIGWLWILSGFVAPMFDLPNFGFFPGLILVFVARIVRRQAERQQLPDTSMGPVEPSQTPPRTRVPAPAPAPEPRRQPPARTIEPEPEPKRAEMLEQILIAGTEMAEEVEMPVSDPGDDTVASPKSSAEMIADARKRWNKPG